MRKLSAKLLILPFLCLPTLFACKKDRPTSAETNNSGIALNAEMMMLGNFFGNVFSNTVLINVQSGPYTQLMTNEFKELLSLTDKEGDLFLFNIHQEQTLHPSDFEQSIDFEAAKRVNQKSVDILARVVQYFKAQDKTVFLFGTGFGAFLIQELIVREGKDIADRYLILGSRLDMPQLIWESYSEGNTGGFIDGKTPFTGAPSTLSPMAQNMNKLFAGLAYKEYTQALAQYNDLSNLTYGYGTLDELYGSLTQNERALLITRKANMLEAEAGHEATIEDLLDAGFSTAFGL